MPGAVFQPSAEVFTVNGRKMLGLHATVTPEQFEQYRTGYRCFACHHFPQPQPFPKVCCEPYCNFEIAKYQIERLTRDFGGYEDLWPTRDEDERRDDLEQHGVWLPPRLGE